MNKILTEEEIKAIADSWLSDFDDENDDMTLGMLVAEAQAKLTREETLKEVGEWLEKYLIGHQVDPDEQYHYAIYYKDINQLKSGNLPEKG
jgi:hypothetical protein